MTSSMSIASSPSAVTDVDRFTVAVIGLAVLFAGACQAALQLFVGFGFGFERDVVVAADPGRLLGLRHLVQLGVGELEKRERAAIGHTVKSVAELDLPLQFRAEVLFAPGCDQRNTE